MNKIKAEEINQNIVHSIDKGETIKQQDWVVGEGGVGGERLQEEDDNSKGNIK